MECGRCHSAGTTLKGMKVYLFCRLQCRKTVLESKVSGGTRCLHTAKKTEYPSGLLGGRMMTRFRHCASAFLILRRFYQPGPKHTNRPTC